MTFRAINVKYACIFDQIQKFIEQMKLKYNKPIYLVDERFTSKIAKLGLLFFIPILSFCLNRGMPLHQWSMSYRWFLKMAQVSNIAEEQAPNPLSTSKSVLLRISRFNPESEKHLFKDDPGHICIIYPQN